MPEIGGHWATGIGRIATATTAIFFNIIFFAQSTNNLIIQQQCQCSHHRRSTDGSQTTKYCKCRKFPVIRCPKQTHTTKYIEDMGDSLHSPFILFPFILFFNSHLKKGFYISPVLIFSPSYQLPILLFFIHHPLFWPHLFPNFMRLFSSLFPPFPHFYFLLFVLQSFSSFQIFILISHSLQIDEEILFYDLIYFDFSLLSPSTQI